MKKETVMKKTSQRMVKTVVATVLTGILAGTASASQVRMSVSTASALLLSEKKQTTYLKVGLTGFEISARERRTPVNVAIVIDKSGSMQGDKISKAREAAILAVERLNQNDIVSVVAYSDTITVLVPSTKVSDKAAIRSGIERLSAGGSTALFAGVSKGAEEVRKFIDRTRVNRIILISDGLANIGPSSPGVLADLGAALGKEGITVTTVGLGLDYNEDLMTQLAKRSDGSSYFAEGSRDLARLFTAEFGDVLSVVAQEVSVKIDCANGIRPVRVLGREAEISGSRVLVSMNQIYSEQEKYVLLEVEVPATGAGESRDIARVTVSYVNMENKATDKLTSTASVGFTDSESRLTRSTNNNVMVTAVKHVATERNKLALELRDQGKIAEAKTELLHNALYLKKNADKYDSQELQDFGAANSDNANKLSEADWGKARKQMRGWQIYNEQQQIAR